MTPLAGGSAIRSAKPALSLPDEATTSSGAPTLKAEPSASMLPLPGTIESGFAAAEICEPGEPAPRHDGAELGRHRPASNGGRRGRRETDLYV